MHTLHSIYSHEKRPTTKKDITRIIIFSPLEKTLFYPYHFILLHYVICGPGSSVGIATELRAGRSRVESRWGRNFPPAQTGPGAHPAFCAMGAGFFPWVKFGQGVLPTTHPLLVLQSWKSRVILLPTLWATPGL